MSAYMQYERPGGVTARWDGGDIIRVGYLTMDVGTADAFILEDELAVAAAVPRTLEAFRSAVDAYAAAQRHATARAADAVRDPFAQDPDRTTRREAPTRWEDTTRGMSGRVHVRVLERSETVVDTTNLDNPCESPAAARAYAMRWKSHGNPRGYRVEFAAAPPRFRCGGCGSPQRGTHYSGCPLAS